MSSTSSVLWRSFTQWTEKLEVRHHCIGQYERFSEQHIGKTMNDVAIVLYSEREVPADI